LVKSWWWCLLAVLAGLVILGVLLSPVPAQEPPVRHEDPEAPELVYDSISLLRFYAEMGDFLLRRDPEAVAAMLGRLPFANVPDNLRELIDELNAHGIELADLAVEVDQGLEDVAKLVGEFRLDESLEVADELADQITRAYAEFLEIQNLVEVIGQRTGAAAAPGGSELRRAYDELVDRVDKKREMLDLHKGPLTDLLPGVRAIKELRPTEVTLEIDTVAAFVREEVRFRGRLTSGNRPLIGRKIDLLLDGTEYDVAFTGEDGSFEGVLRVPYNYVPEVVLEALYRPHDEDIGLYLASRSPPDTLNVLFYSAALTLRLEDKAYPGRQTEVRGGFDYGDYPVPQARQIEVYLDDLLVARAEVGSQFSLFLKLDQQTEPDRRRITVAAPAEGRYAPVVASAYLRVVQATPEMDLDLPWVALIPGDIEVSGRVSSEVGPISRGEIILKLGGAEVKTRTAEDGSFALKIRRGMGMELIGSQALKVRVIPQEPWHAATISSESLFVVNWVNSGGILLGLLALGILARRRARKFELPRRRKGEVVDPPPPVEQRELDIIASIDALPAEEPRRRIVGWYRRVVRLLLQVFHLVFGPSQTPREFLREVSPRLGPAAGFFAELTRLVERALYSPRQPTDEEAQRGEEISRQVEGGVKGV